MKSSRGATDRSARSAARLAAVQGLYQMDLAATDLNVVIDEIANRQITETHEETAFDGGGRPADGSREQPASPYETAPDSTFLAEILRGVVRMQREIDPMVDAQLAVGWRLARVDSILRAILRAGVFELIERKEVPGRVVINEYVEVAHAFLPSDETRVVNGVLDKLARRLRPAEFVSA